MSAGAANAALAADRAARRLAQRDFVRPVVLEAGAGTGKTTTLVARVLAWALGPGWERAALAEAAARRDAGRPGAPSQASVAARVLGGVVAITFTEAAAAQMAKSVAVKLRELAPEGADLPPWMEAALPPDAERAGRAAALLGALDHLVVRTIHAFCRGLLADHALAAGLHPELTVDADGSLLEELARETVEGSLQAAYGAAAAADPYLRLAARGFGPQELVGALVALVSRGAQADTLDADPLAPAAEAAFRARLAAACGGLRDLVAPRRAELRRAPKSLRALDTLEELAAAAEDGGPLAELVARAGGEAAQSLLSKAGEWARGELKSKTERTAFAAVTDELAERATAAHTILHHAARLDLELLDLGRRALAPLLARLRAELRARGVVTFEDLLIEAARLLAEHPGVTARLRAGIDQLLVDEFQDTDRLQCEIVRRLALEGPEEERPGLFLVGDPKQSIYGWRSADLAAYDDFVERAVAAGAQRLPLVENFRSVPAILAEVERAIAPVMRAERGVQPPFEGLVACPGNAAATGFVGGGDGPPREPVEHWVSWRPPDGAATKAEAATIVEAEAIAADVRDLHDRAGVGWGECALLLRSTTSLDTFLEAFRRADVPFAVAHDKQYYRRREVIEAAALVRAVLDPGDHLALLTLLRSPLVGVPDAALVPLWSHSLPALVTELSAPRPERLERIAEAVAAAAAEVPAAIPGIERLRGWEMSLLAALEHLAHARAALRQQPADVFVERLRALFLAEPLEAARYLGRYRLANLERFYRRLADGLEEGGDLAQLLRGLRRAVAEALEAPEGQPGEGADDAVQVMTIHQAKGLDFGHVYLPQLHREGGGDRGPRTELAHAAGGPELRLFGAPTLGFDRVEAEAQRREAAERVRLLYVAMTRPEVRLVLAGAWPRDPAAVPADRARTHLDLLASRPDLPQPPPAGRWDAALAADDGSGTHFRDPAGVLWRFPALERWPRPPAAAAAKTYDGAAARTAADAAELAERRERARRRMSRPTAATASEEAHHRLREEAGGDDAAAAPRARQVALAAGTALHRALEELDPDAPPAAEIARLRRALPGWAAEAAGAGAAEEAAAAAHALLDRLAEGRLLERLRALAPGIVARELPVLLPPAPAAEDPADPASAPPVGFVAGAIDLLYRDPETGGLVVADYKTDAVEGEAELAARAAAYAPQGAVYVRAVREALELPADPRFELWFLRADRVVTPPEDGAATAPPAPTPAPAPRAEPAPTAVGTPAPSPSGPSDPRRSGSPAPTPADPPEPTAAERSAPAASEAHPPPAAHRPGPHPSELSEPTEPSASHSSEPAASEPPEPAAAEPTAAEAPEPPAAEPSGPTAADAPGPADPDRPVQGTLFDL